MVVRRVVLSFFIVQAGSTAPPRPRSGHFFNQTHMSKTSCLVRPCDDTFVVLRASYVKICQGNIVAAALLSIFEYWHNYKMEEQGVHRRYNKIAARHGEGTPYEDHLLQHHTIEELTSHLMGIGGKGSIIKARQLLVELGYISEHRNPNPRYRFDNTVFFFLHADTINSALNADGGPIENLPSSNFGRTISNDPSKDTIEERGEISPTPPTVEPKPAAAVPPAEKILRASEHEGIEWPWDTDTFRDAWRTWREFKRLQHKFVYKLKASEQAALNHLRQLSGDSEALAHAIITQSMAQGWKGFFELKTINHATPQGAAPIAGNGTKTGISAARVDAIGNW